MRIRRVRYAPIGTAADRGWREVAVYDDATVVQADDCVSLPGRTFCLGVTTPGHVDRLWVEMVGGEMDCVSGISFRGFVSRQELTYEAAWLEGDDEGCADARDRDELTGQYVREEWYVLESVYS